MTRPRQSHVVMAKLRLLVWWFQRGKHCASHQSLMWKDVYLSKWRLEMFHMKMTVLHSPLVSSFIFVDVWVCACVLVLFWYTKTKTKMYFSKGVHHFSILTKTKPKYNTPPLLKPIYNYFFLHELKLELKIFLVMSFW